MDGLMVGWEDGGYWMDGWMHGWMDVWVDGWVGRWMGGLMVGRGGGETKFPSTVVCNPSVLVLETMLATTSK